MTDDPDVRMAQSIVDYIFRRLALDFLPFETRSALGIHSAEERSRPARADEPTAADEVDVEGLAQSAPRARAQRPAEQASRSRSARRPEAHSSDRAGGDAAGQGRRRAAVLLLRHEDAPGRVAATSARAAARPAAAAEHVPGAPPRLRLRAPRGAQPFVHTSRIRCTRCTVCTAPRGSARASARGSLDTVTGTTAGTGGRSTMRILVTGGTGTLGRVVVERLRERATCPPGAEPPRGGGAGRRRPGRQAGGGRGHAGVDAVVHAASRPSHDVTQTETLLAALRAEGARPATGSVAAAGESGGHADPHLVFISIVGVDRVPLAYYREKVEVERLVAAAGVPWTVLRPPSSTTCCRRCSASSAGLRCCRCSPGRRSSRSTCATSHTASPTSSPVRPSAGRPTWAARRSARWPTSPAPGPARRAGAARCCRCGCPVGSHARCGPGLITPEHADGRITFEEFLAGQTSHSASGAGAAAVGERGPRTSRRELVTLRLLWRARGMQGWRGARGPARRAGRGGPPLPLSGVRRPSPDRRSAGRPPSPSPSSPSA